MDVELLDGQGATTERLAAGEAELGLTATLYFLRARAASAAGLPVRFAMPLHQRDPIAALVRDDSELVTPQDLPDRSVARWGLAFMTEAYTWALARLNAKPSQIVPVEGDPSAALRAGTVDVVPSWAETIPVRSYAGVTVRAVPLGGQGYASGLIAADAVSDEVLLRVREALTAAFSLQRDHPHIGVEPFCERYPHIPRADAFANWRGFEPFAFPATSETRAVDPDQWTATVADTVEAHQLPMLDADRLYRIG